MTEDKIDTYVLTIKNGVDSTTITSVQKNNEELLGKDKPIDLDNETTASDQLNSAINPVAALPQQQNQPPEEKQEEIKTQTQEQKDRDNKILNTKIEGTDYTLGTLFKKLESSNNELLSVKLTGNFMRYTLKDLMMRLTQIGGLNKHYERRQKLLYAIIEKFNSKDSWTNRSYIESQFTQLQENNKTLKSDNKLGEVITNEISKIYFEGVDTNKRGNYFSIHNDIKNLVLGGTHHTRKRTHKPRNTKSNTRKGHIYRTNHRRTHGKSSAHGKKQTRRIVNR